MPSLIFNSVLMLCILGASALLERLEDRISGSNEGIDFFEWPKTESRHSTKEEILQELSKKVMYYRISYRK